MSDLTVLNNKSIVFVGGGNMARALIDGLLEARTAQNVSLTIGVSDPVQENLDNFAKKGIKTSLPENVSELMNTADIVVLAVKPQVMAQACQPLQPLLKDKLVISIAAGLGLDKLMTMMGTSRIVRVMPNLPATVGLGASGLYATVCDDDKALATAVMAASGVAIWVDDEDSLHTVTAVAGSAPAYFFYVLENMIAKAVAFGLDEKSAKVLAVQTMAGAAKMAVTGDPAILRSQVTSKGGTTHAAISYFEQQGVGEEIKNAMQACYDRSVELGKNE